MRNYSVIMTAIMHNARYYVPVFVDESHLTLQYWC